MKEFWDLWSETFYFLSFTPQAQRPNRRAAAELQVPAILVSVPGTARRATARLPAASRSPRTSRFVRPSRGHGRGDRRHVAAPGAFVFVFFFFFFFFKKR